MPTYMMCQIYSLYYVKWLRGKLLKGQLHYTLAQLQIEQYKVIIMFTETW